MIKTNDIRQFLSTCNHDLLQIILITKYVANVPGVHLLHSSFLLYSNIKKKKNPSDTVAGKSQKSWLSKNNISLWRVSIFLLFLWLITCHSTLKIFHRWSGKVQRPCQQDVTYSPHWKHTSCYNESAAIYLDTISNYKGMFHWSSFNW